MAVVQAYRDYRQDQWGQLASKRIEALKHSLRKTRPVWADEATWIACAKDCKSQTTVRIRFTAKVEESKTNDNAGALGGAPFGDAKREFEQMVDFHRMLAAEIEAEQLALHVREWRW